MNNTHFVYVDEHQVEIDALRARIEELEAEIAREDDVVEHKVTWADIAGEYPTPVPFWERHPRLHWLSMKLCGN